MILSRRTLLPATAVVSAMAVAAATVSTADASSRADRHPTRFHSHTVVGGLDGPRGVDNVARGLTLVTESDGSFSLVVQRKHRRNRVIELGNVGAPGLAPAIAKGRHGWVYLLTGAGDAKLYRWRHGWAAPRVWRDIGAYQQRDVDPADLEDNPTESNPFGLAVAKDGSVLVADAAGNDLLRVRKGKRIQTVARFLPRTVEVPEGLPATDPGGNPLPPAGTPIPSEAVSTSVTLGPDGYWYVGELRGFPATPGTSQIWRIKPGSVGATCDPAHPYRGACRRYVDGRTSIVDLAGSRHAVYGVQLSNKSWLAMELGVAGAEIGSVFRVRHHPRRTRVLDRLRMPSGIDAGYGGLYVVAPFFGPGALLRYH